MPPKIRDPTSKVPLCVLGAVCFITLFMCQTRFKISKEIKPEVTPPLLKSEHVSKMYGFGKPDRFRLVLKTVVGVTSPLLSVLSSGLLVVGRAKCNPYLFLPWFFVTVRGITVVQTENLAGILRELFMRYDKTYAFSLEDWKWSCLYFTLVLFIVAESFALFEVFEIFRSVWEKRREAGEESVKTEAIDLEKSLSNSSMKSTTTVRSCINNYHTVTSLCKFGFLSGQRSDTSITNLNSLVALFHGK